MKRLFLWALFCQAAIGFLFRRPSKYRFDSHYSFPPRCCYTETKSLEALKRAKDNDPPPTGVYVHIPFCRRRCRYCNFAIVPIGAESSGNEGFRRLNTDYEAAILKEVQLVADSSRDGGKIPVRSVYFGGGTPSLAPIETLRRVLQAITATSGESPFVLADNAEISIEMDPGTFSKAKLQAVKDMGFNRISLGVQSFDDDMLESLGRVHRRQDVFDAVAMLKEVFGGDLNYSVDLISGLPGLSLAKWIETLQTAVHLDPRPQHLSLYDLQIESGTVFGTWYHEKKETTHYKTKGEAPITIQPLPSGEESAFMYKFAAGYLRAHGYEHYEVSSYALKEDVNHSHRSQHNQVYWDANGQWYAFGLGATSFVEGRLTSRPKTFAEYLRWADDQWDVANSAGDSVPRDSETDVSSDLDVLMDVVLKRLRTSEGLALDWVRNRFEARGESYVEAILRGAQLGIELNLAIHEGGTLRLVEPDGFLYSNSIISSIFAELEDLKDA